MHIRWLKVVVALGALRRRELPLSVACAQTTPDLQHTHNRLQWLAPATPDSEPLA